MLTNHCVFINYIFDSFVKYSDRPGIPDLPALLPDADSRSFFIKIKAVDAHA